VNANAFKADGNELGQDASGPRFRMDAVAANPD
jgi:hypothetical protein